MSDPVFVNILETAPAVKENVRQWRNRDDIKKCMLSQNIITQEEHARWLDGLSRREDSRFWVVFSDDVPVGAAYLQNIDRAKSVSEWGFYIGDAAYKGRGLGHRILFEVLEEVFDRMTLKTLFTRVLSDNAPALHLYRKFHFREKENSFLEDGREVVLMEFTQAEWAGVKEELRTLCNERVEKSAE